MPHCEEPEEEDEEEEEEDEDEDEDVSEPCSTFPPCPTPTACSARPSHGCHNNTQGNHRSIKEGADHLTRRAEPVDHLSRVIAKGVAMIPVMMY